MSGTFILNTILFLSVSRALRRTSKWRLALLGTLFLVVEVAFFTSSSSAQGIYKVVHVTMRCGYRNRQNVPQALAQARRHGLLERNLDLEHASYFLLTSRCSPTTTLGSAAGARSCS
jgi:K+ transporter